MTKRPVSAIGNRRPISEYARVAAALGGNPRYKVTTCINLGRLHIVLLAFATSTGYVTQRNFICLQLFTQCLT